MHPLFDSSFSEQLTAAAHEIMQVIAPERVHFNAQELYGICTTGATRQIPFAVKAVDRNEILHVLSVARAHRLPVYTISTGKNWGYGTANPVENFCIVLDLSLMNRILDFSSDLASVRVQPGVTQGQLYQFMQEHGHEFLVPVTGAGPHASLMGNLLERGYGITPHTDHFAALLSLEAILPNGEVYSSTLNDLGCGNINHHFKWGLGPYLDGLFAQSNFGIVVECTIALMRKPQSISGFIFTLNSPKDVGKAAEALRNLSQSLPGILGGMNLMNSHRMLAMTAPFPSAQVKPGESISAELMQDLCRQHNIAAWTGIGGIYGTKAVVKAAKKEIRRQLRPLAKKLTFIDERTLSTLNLVSEYVPEFLNKKALVLLSQKARKVLDVVSGVPTEAALPLSYWKTQKKYTAKQKHNIATDDCGLIWYSPLVLNRDLEIEKYISFVQRICQKYAMEPLITLTTVSERCFDSTVPLLFDRKDKDALQRAQQCYQELLLEGQKLGFFPYRLGIEQMAQIVENPDSVSWKLVEKIKNAVDPLNILSPGRYCPSKSVARGSASS